MLDMGLVSESAKKATDLLKKCDSLEREVMQLEEEAIEIEADKWKDIPRIDLLNHSLIQGKIERSRRRWKWASLILGTALATT